jgi:asparagine synthase (glutamine-hydrolysing)
MELSSVGARSYVQDFFGVGLDDPDSPLFAHLPRWATSAQAKRFLARDFADAIPGSAREAVAALVPDRSRRWSRFNRAQYVEAKLLMSGYLLSSQGDRMLMENSVEGRFPFLDPRIIDFAARLDPRLKMRVLNEKYLLKMAAEDYLPEKILQRPKQPYRAPDAGAFFGPDHPTPEYVEALLSEETLRRTGYFDPHSTGLLVAKARRGGVRSVRDNQALVGILSTQLWHHHFIDRYDADFAADR